LSVTLIDIISPFETVATAAKKPVTNSNHIVGGVDPLGLSYISNRQHVNDENDKKSSIRYVDPAYINEFVTKFEALINE
jgi:hypothetical protein